MSLLDCKAEFLGAHLPALTCLLIIGLASLVFGAQPVAAQAHNDKPMALSGYSMSQAYGIEDDITLDLNSKVVNRLLYRIKKTSPKSRGEYARYSKEINWDQIIQETEEHRFWLFQRRVQLKRISKHRFPDVTADTEIKGVFVCYCENEKGEELIVLASSVPRNLQAFEKGSNEVKIDQAIGFGGFLLNRVVDSDDSVEQPVSNEAEIPPPSSTPVFVADRIEWFPRNANYCDPSHVILARAGADIGQIDFVRKHNTQRLGKADSEAFFQFLAAAQNAPADNGIEDRLGFIDIMQNPKSNFCQAASITGVVRRCTKIAVNNPEIINRLGISHYYDMIIFPDLDGGKIVVKNKSKEDLEYRRFPITVCCAELPEGMDQRDIEKKRVSIDGYFYRFWKFQSDKTDLAGTTGQVSPLIMAKRPTTLKPQASYLNVILMVFAGLAFGGVAMLLYSHRLADRRRKSPGQEIMDSLPEQIDLSGISE